MSNEKIYEIERKFLVKTLPDLNGAECHRISQGYISTNPTIRIRQWDDSYILTVKGGGGLKRVEYELELSEEQYNNLSEKVENNIIIKKRYIIPLCDNLKAELDIYDGYLSGFKNVEVEFDSVEKAVLFNPPEWFGKEITQDRRYSNGSLSKNGIPNDYNPEDI